MLSFLYDPVQPGRAVVRAKVGPRRLRTSATGLSKRNCVAMDVGIAAWSGCAGLEPDLVWEAV